MENNNLVDSMRESILNDNISKIDSDSINDLLSKGLQSVRDINIPIVGCIIQISTSISDTMFMKKCLKFLKGISDIPKEKRYEFIGDLSVRNQEDAAELILSIINKLDHPQKIELICKLFKAKVFDEISIDDFIRLSFMIEKCPYIDLLYLREYEKPNYIPGSTELLSSAGLIEKTIYDFGGAEGGGCDKYSLTNLGKILLRLSYRYRLET